MSHTTVRALTAALLVAGCSSAATRSSSGGDASRLTQDQLAATNSGTVYDAVEKLRPEWLTSRGPTSITNPTPTVASVFMNGQLLGKIDYLREVRVIDVSEVRYWPAGPAAAKYGMGHPRGVIELTRN
jgi:hypothetical protein